MEGSDVLNSSVEMARQRALATTSYADESAALNAAREGGKSGSDVAANAFEKMLARMVVKELRRGLGDGFFGTGAGADVYGSWLEEHLGQTLSESGALGIAGMIKTALGDGPVDAGASRTGDTNA